MTPFFRRSGDLTIFIEHSVVPFTESINIAISDGYDRRWIGIGTWRNYFRVLAEPSSDGAISCRLVANHR
jgi:hypothetical protein